MDKPGGDDLKPACRDEVALPHIEEDAQEANGISTRHDRPDFISPLPLRVSGSLKPPRL